MLQQIEKAKYYQKMHKWNSTPVLSLIGEHGLPRMTPGLPALLHSSCTSVIHQCRVETSGHSPSSDQKCMDFHGSFQIIYGAKPEQDCRALPIARIISSPNRRTWVVDPMRKELKPYCPWLRKAIPDLAYGTSAYSSGFGLRDIGTLFPI